MLTPRTAARWPAPTIAPDPTSFCAVQLARRQAARGAHDAQPVHPASIAELPSPDRAGVRVT